MGNAASDSGEEAAYKIIRWIPGVGQVYSVSRAIAYAAKGNDQQAIDSLITGGGGIWGSAANAIRDSDLFDRNDTFTDSWKGDKQAANALPKDRYQAHLFDVSKFFYLFDDTVSTDVLDLFDVSRDEISTVEGTYTNVPAVANGVNEFSYFDAITTNVVLTSYLLAYSRKSAQCAVFVTTFKFYSSANIFKVTELYDTKRREVEAVMHTYRDCARDLNARNMQSLLKF